MNYIFAYASSIMMFGLALSVMTLVFKGRDLGYLSVFLGVVIFLCACFIPLFYGSVGGFFQWQNADAFYAKAWIPFALIPPVLVVYFFVIDKILKR